MQQVKSGQANDVFVDMVAKATGNAIIAGTVNVYLVAVGGDNDGKWWDGSAWQSTETLAGTATYKSTCIWRLEVVEAAWTLGVSYRVYGEESGDLHIPYSDPVVVITEDVGPVQYEYPIMDASTGNPVVGATVWCTTDEYGVNRVQTTTTGTNGIALFNLDAGSYYFWATASGYASIRADLKVVN